MIAAPLLLGHRGARASSSVPENTLASFDLALTHGCDGFEFDVRLTSCGRAVVCHDAKVRGITVADATRDQLLELPVLQDVLRHCGGRAFLDIELKVSGLESALLIALHAHSPERGFVVSSFLPEVVMDLRARSAQVPLGIICDRRSELAQWPELPVEYVIPHETLVTWKLVEQVHTAGRSLLVWTVNAKASMLRLREWGVDGIISDDTELLVKTLR
jgi:glycerophosphoryl diester phosphodiesterase